MALDRERLRDALPGYEVVREVGRGGSGVVFEGVHQSLGRRVAIKQLPRAFGASPLVRKRFLQEAQLLAQFDHPHIVPVYDFVEQEDLCLLVMEYLPGGTVWERMTGPGVTTEAACAIAVSACAGLGYAHERGVLHRDVKPANLVFSEAGLVKVTDFGVAKMLGGSETLATGAGDVVGSPGYIAPEQVLGKDLSPATDLYALGIMLYEMLSGRLPYGEQHDLMVLLMQHVNAEPAPLAEVEQSARPVVDVVMRCLAKDPGDRHQTGEESALAIIEAAAASFEPVWVEACGIPIRCGGRIERALEEAAARPAVASSPRASQRVSRVVVDPNLQQPTPAIGSGELDVMPLAELVQRVTHQPVVEARFFVVEVAESGAPPRQITVREPVDVGRQATGIVLTDAEVSRRHLVLEPSGETLVLVDLGSTNGTKLNGKRVKGRAILRVGDVIALGKTRLRVVGEERREVSSDPRAPTPPSATDDAGRKRAPRWFRRR